MKHHRFITLAGLLLLLVIGWSPAYGAPPQKKAPGGEVPLRITAARMEADQKEGIIIFTGQVKADYGDATLYSDQLRVYYKAQPAPPKGAAPPPPKPEEQSPLGDLGGQKIDHIVARGHVRFVQATRSPHPNVQNAQRLLLDPRGEYPPRHLRSKRPDLFPRRSSPPSAPCGI